MIKIGDKIPFFDALSGYEGKKLIIYFYPKDNTSGCTAEACSIRDGYSELLKMGYTVLGISPDNENSHRKFAEKYELPFVLIPDIDNTIALDFGVWAEKKMYGRTYMGILRTTFITDENWVLTHIITKVNTKTHFEQIVEIVK